MNVARSSVPRPPTAMVGPPGRHSRYSHTVRWVYDVLHAELANGVYSENVLPPEEVLMRRYAVSRGTIRRVVDLLRNQGVLERLRGAGTFVRTPMLLHHGIDISRDIVQDVGGQRVSIFKTFCELHPATGFVAGQLRVEASTPVIILETLTYLDGFPLSVRTAFMPDDVFAALREKSFNLDRTPYEIMEEILGEPLGETHLLISATGADEAVSELLGVPQGSPLLTTERVVLSRADRPLEYSVGHSRADRVGFSTIMDALDR